MIPPFFTVDHRIDSSIFPFEERRVLRRSGPSRLRFDLPTPGMPMPQPTAQPPAEPLRETPRGCFARLASMVRLWSPA